jgi:hypothetical protein
LMVNETIPRFVVEPFHNADETFLCHYTILVQILYINSKII